MQALTKKQVKDKLNYLQLKKNKLETDNQTVKRMLIFNSLPQGEKNKIAEEWEGYYKVIKNSRSYERYCTQRDAFKRGDMARVKELAQEAKEEREQKTDWIPKPSSINPNEFSRDYDCQNYWGTIKKIGEIKKELLESGDEETMAEEIFA